jgi:hypothetical protein
VVQDPNNLNSSGTVSCYQKYSKCVQVPLVVTKKYSKCVQVLKLATRNIIWKFNLHDIWAKVFFATSGDVFMPRPNFQRLFQKPPKITLAVENGPCSEKS